MQAPCELDGLKLDRSSYLRVTLACLWDDSPQLVLASVLFCLLCAPAATLFAVGALIPAVVLGVPTIAPAWAALLDLEAALLQGRRAGVGTMLRSLGRYWLRSTTLGAILGLPLISILSALPHLSQPEMPAAVWPSLFSAFVLAGIAVALCLYAIPLLVLQGMGPCSALHKATQLASGHIGNTVALLSMGLLFGLAIECLSSGLVFFLPTVWGLFIVNNCRLVLAETTEAGIERR